MDQSESTLSPCDTVGPQRRGYRWAKRIVVYIVAVACLVWVFRDVHIRPLFAAMKIASWRIVALAIMLDILTYVLQGVRWRSLLLPVGTLATLRATQGIYAGLFVNEVVPLRFGELVRAFMVSRWLSVSFAAILPSIVIERFLDGLWLVVCVGIAAIFVPLPKALITAGEILGVTVLVATAFFIWIGFRNQQHFENSEPGSRSPIVVKLFGYVSQFNQGLRDIGMSPGLFLALLLSVAMLVLQIFVLRFMLQACQIDLSLLSAAVVFLIIRLGTTLPNAPANIGTFQFFTVIGLRSFGVGKTVAAAFSIVYFGALTLPLWTLGLLAIAFSGLNLQMARWLWQGCSARELRRDVDVP